jgi:uncharacterized protein (DUF2267 family)
MPMDTQAFYREVRERLGQCELEEAKRGTAAVYHALRDRLTPDEADQVAAQLPGPLKVVWSEGDEAERTPLKMDREEFYERVRGDAGLLTAREAQWLTLAVFATLKKQLSPGEAEDVMAQLPKDLKEAWVEAV